MAKRGSKTTTFSKENQPANKRGKTHRTRIIEALERQGKTEEEFLDLLVIRSLDQDDAFTMKELMGRMYPLSKAVMPMVEFEFTPDASASDKADQIIQAASDGKIPPDVAKMFVDALSSMIRIKELTEINDRIQEMERMMGLTDG